MSIFWILLPLCLACAYHPLASSVHTLSRFRRYLHVSPIFCFIDSIYLIIQCCVLHAQDSMTWRRAIEVVVKHRLREFLSLPVARAESGDEMQELPAVEGNSGMPPTTGAASEQQKALPISHSEATPEAISTDSTSSTLSRPTISGESLAPTLVVARAALNTYVRIIANTLIMLTYIRICGFRGIRPWLILADLFFNSWLIMEAFLIIGYYAAPRERLDADDSPDSSVLTQNSHEPTPAVGASVLTPLFLEVLVSGLALYYKAGGVKVKYFFWDMVEPTCLGTWEYLVDRPFTATLNLPHPFWFPVTILALLPGILGLLFISIITVIAYILFLAAPVGYTLGLYFLFLLFEWLLKRYNHTVGTISARAINIIEARVLVAIICTHYIVYFFWFYDPAGTTKDSWTELLGRRLR